MRFALVLAAVFAFCLSGSVSDAGPKQGEFDEKYFRAMLKENAARKIGDPLNQPPLNSHVSFMILASMEMQEKELGRLKERVAELEKKLAK